MASRRVSAFGILDELAEQVRLGRGRRCGPGRPAHACPSPACGSARTARAGRGRPRARAARPIACRVAVAHVAARVGQQRDERACPSSAVPILPMAVAAAPRTDGVGVLERRLRGRVPRSVPSGYRAPARPSRRIDGILVAQGRRPAPRTTDRIHRRVGRHRGPVVLVREDVRGSARHARRCARAPRRSPPGCRWPPRGSCGRRRPSAVTSAGTAGRSRSSRRARTISRRTFTSGSRTSSDNGGIASRRRLLPSSAAASWRVLALGLFRLATRSAKVGLLGAGGKRQPGTGGPRQRPADSCSCAPQTGLSPGAPPGRRATRRMIADSGDRYARSFWASRDARRTSRR